MQLDSLGPRLSAGGTAELFQWESGRILKLYWEGATLEAVEREAQRARIAHKLGAPAPMVYDVVTVEERPGVVFERIEGRAMLDVLAEDPAQAETLAAEIGALHADLHVRSATELPPLREHLIRRINLGPLPARNKHPVLALLGELPDGRMLCHGDLHPGNVLVTAAGLRAIDWFDATAGNPTGDLARTAMLMQYAKLPGSTERSRQAFEAVRTRFIERYLSEYKKLRPQFAAALADWFVPVAAARIAEPISAQERNSLLKVIDALLAEA